MVAVHLSNNQRFAEAQKWFHLVFDPTSTDTSVPAPERFWKSFVFRNGSAIQNINTLLSLLSTPTELDAAQIQAKPTSSPATTPSWPTRSIRTSSPAPGRAPTSGTS